jgi:hypothetical protein
MIIDICLTIEYTFRMQVSMFDSLFCCYFIFIKFKPVSFLKTLRLPNEVYKENDPLLLIVSLHDLSIAINNNNNNNNFMRKLMNDNEITYF